MKARDRSLLVGGASFVGTCLVILVAFVLLNSRGDSSPGQFIDNNTAADGEGSAAAGSTADSTGGGSGAGEAESSTASSTPAFTAGPTDSDDNADSLSDGDTPAKRTGAKAASPAGDVAPSDPITTLRPAAPVIPSTSPTNRAERGSGAGDTTPAVATAPRTDTGVKTPTPRKPAPTTTTTAAPTTTTTVPTTATTASTTTTTAAPTTTTTAPTTTAPSGGVNAVEQEIYRFTNELRADPSGPLARRKPMPSCVSEPFYGISIDSDTGHPNSVGALSLSEPVSLSMSRPWAVEMNGRNSMDHRSNGSQLEIYGQLGIGIAATGENIAWFSGYSDAQAARTHFEGWRESDSGHYCALVAGTYTHIGVGHHKGATRSWAVQNFYRQR